MPNKNGAKNAQKAKVKSKPAPAAKAAKPAAKPPVKAAAKTPAPVKGKAAPAPAPVKEAKKAAPVAPAKAAKETPAPAEPAAKHKKEEIVQAASIQITMEPPPDEEVILTDAEGRRYCKVKDCDQYAVVEDHCRFHYLLLWKRIQVRRRILIDGKLERYVEELTARYPDKFLEMIRKDLRSEKDFHAAIAELEIDESAMENEFEDENNSFIDEVRGMSSEPAMADEEEF